MDFSLPREEHSAVVFNTFPLKTCQPPARALYEALSIVVPDESAKLNPRNEDGSARILTYGESARIRTAATELEAVLKAELSNWDTFFVSQKGGYSTADLINNAEKLLPESAQQYLSNESLEDVRRCGQCLAFNLGVAAAFHIVRAVEDYITKYYEHVTGTRPSVKARNWGAYIKNLQNCGEADSKVLGWMIQIKDQYRNPVLHPEEVVEPDDAMEFMSACISLMAAISRALLRAGILPQSPAPGQLTP